MEYRHLQEVLQRYGEYAKERMKQNLLQDGSNASGTLVNSIDYIYSHSGNTYEVSIRLEDYWKYLNDGTKPHFPPVNAIEEWVKVKKIVPQVRSLPNGKEYLPTVKQLAFLIARKISEVGTEGTGFFDRAAEDTYDRFILEIEMAVTEDLNEELDNIFINTL